LDYGQPVGRLACPQKGTCPAVPVFPAGRLVSRSPRTGTLSRCTGGAANRKRFGWQRPYCHRYTTTSQAEQPAQHEHLRR